MFAVEASRKAEIRQLDMAILVDKDVVWFDVTEAVSVERGGSVLRKHTDG